MRIFGLALCLSLGCHVGWLGLFDVGQTFGSMTAPMRRDITFLGAFLQAVRPAPAEILSSGGPHSHTLELPSGSLDWRSLDALEARPLQLGSGLRPAVPAATLVAMKLQPSAASKLSQTPMNRPIQGSVLGTLGGAASTRALLSREALGSWAEWELDSESPSRAVVLEFSIEPDGRVSKVTCIQSSGVAVLDARCVRHVAAWRFAPLPQDAEPSSAVGTWRFQGEGARQGHVEHVEVAP